MFQVYKELSTADTFYRAPTTSSNTSDEEFSQEVAVHVVLVMQHLPVIESWLYQIAQLQVVDEMCKQI